MFHHKLRRSILVLCISLSAAFSLTPLSADAQVRPAPGAAGGTPNTFFQALRTIDSQQHTITATRGYALSGTAPTAAQPLSATRLYPATVPPVAPAVSSAPATRSGQTPFVFPGGTGDR